MEKPYVVTKDGTRKFYVFIPAVMREDGWYYCLGPMSKNADGWSRVPPGVTVTTSGGSEVAR